MYIVKSDRQPTSESKQSKAVVTCILITFQSHPFINKEVLPEVGSWLPTANHCDGLGSQSLDGPINRFPIDESSLHVRLEDLINSDRHDILRKHDKICTFSGHD
jgi:hypothetical protein